MRKVLPFPISPLYLLAVLVLLAGIAFALLKPRTSPALSEEYLPDRYMWPQPPTTQFTVKKVPAVKELDPAELVLGVTMGQESRAYPINMLNHQPAAKVVNDTLAGRPILASWCDSAHNAIVYSREVEGKPLLFGVFGQLWKGSMVMYDKGTMTQWCHILGEAKRGPLKGKQLKKIPSLVTDWESWRRLYPEGTVVLFPEKGTEYTRKIYQDGEQYLLGIAADGKSRTWSFIDLAAKPVRNDVWQEQPVLVIFEAASATARLFNRTVQGQVLTFALEGKDLKDRETCTTWEAISGQALSGPLAGKYLPSLPAFVSYRKIWKNFYPDSGDAK